MKTKLSEISESTIRNLFFFSIITTPLLFNVSTKRIFEPDKISVLRSMGTIALVCFLIYVFEKGKDAFKEFSGKSKIVLIFGLYYILSELLSCIFSITPMYSIWGSYHRLQGFYTSITYFILFLAAYYILNSELWLKTFINILIGTSMPITIWAIFQAIGIDPIPWAVKDISLRVTSSLGNPIFLSAYLIMVIPLTLSKIVGIFDCVKKRNSLYYLNLSLHIVLLIAQITIVFLTKSRGPAIGFMAGILFFILLYGKISGRKTIRYISVFVIVIALIGSVFVLNSLMSRQNDVNTTTLSGNDNPERILNITAVESGTGKVRVLIWKGVINLLKSSSLFRIFTGYGQESMYVSYNKFYSPELSNIEQIAAVPDRSHNAPFDVISTKGVIGLLAYIGIILAVFSFALRKTNIVQSPSKRRLFWIAGISLPLILPLFVFIFTVYQEYSGIAIGMGILLALTIALLTGKNKEEEERNNNPFYLYELYAIGLLSGIAAHIAETQTGIPIATTKLYFWIYAGAIVSILSANSGKGESKDGMDKETTSPDIKGLSYWFAFLVNIFMITGGFDIISSDVGLKRAPGLYIGFIVAIWFFTASLFILSFISDKPAQEGKKNKKASWTPFVLNIYGFSAAIFIIISLIYFFIIKPDTSLNHFAITEKIANFEAIFTAFLVIISVIMAVLKAKTEKTTQTLTVNKLFFPLYAVALVSAVFFIVKINVNPIKADSYFSMSSVMKKSPNQDAMIPYLQKAVDLNFGDENYRKAFALLYMRKGISEKPGNRRKMFRKAVDQALVACRTNSANSHNFYILGLIYKRWAFIEKDKERKDSLYKKAFEAFDTAIDLSPGRGYIFREAGEGYALSGDLTKARNFFRKATRLTPKDVIAWTMLGDSERKLKNFDKAIEAYEQAIKVKPKFIRAYSSIAYIYAVTGENDKSIEYNLKVLKISPNDYDAHKNMAILYNINGNYNKSLEEARKALDLARDKDKKKMTDFIERLKRKL